MTVSSTTSIGGPYNTDGTTVLFTFGFDWIETSDLVVSLLNVSTGVITQGNLTTDFVITPGSGDGNSGTILGGSITIQPNAFSGIANVSGQLPVGYTLTISRSIGLLQQQAYPEGGDFPSAAAEQGYDRLTIADQQIQAAINQAIQIPVVDGEGVTTTLPAKAQRANMALLFDSNGNIIVGQSSSANVSAAMVPVVQAATLALARTAFGLGPSAVLSQAFTTESTLASAATTDLGTATSNLVDITGTTTITSLSATASPANPLYFIRFSGILTLTNSASLILPSGANITTAAGDCCIAKVEPSNVVRIIGYFPASGKAVVSPALATSGAAGLVQPDNGSITISAGVITANYGLLTALAVGSFIIGSANSGQAAGTNFAGSNVTTQSIGATTGTFNSSGTTSGSNSLSGSWKLMQTVSNATQIALFQRYA